jgi:signal peptidase I
MAKTKPKKTDARFHKTVAAGEKEKAKTKSEDEGSASRAIRETVESVVIAFILAFFVRAFEAEAFRIPTGSMAHTLMGRHKDIECDQCGFQFQAGASCEVDSDARSQERVDAATCPMCGYTTRIDQKNPGHTSFGGDRIIVSKFAYELFEPERWDVIVFKYPGNPKQNYIKRLVGLPRETLRIQHGDIFVRPEGEERFHIARKSPEKLKAMMQDVYDARYVARALENAGWPARWRAVDGVGETTDDSDWTSHYAAEQGRTFAFDASAESESVSWLRYHHRLPVGWDTQNLPVDPVAEVEYNRTITTPFVPKYVNSIGPLITDFYSYNAYIGQKEYKNNPDTPMAGYRNLGLHWVGDLAVECNVEVESSTGELYLDLVEGGTHFRCAIDLADGTARLSMSDPDGNPLPMLSDGGGDPIELVGQTEIRGQGRYKLRFANADDTLIFWVDNKVVPFTLPAAEEPYVYTDPLTGKPVEGVAYAAPTDVRPVWSEANPGDAQPVGVGCRGATLKVQRLAVYRDLYYIASTTSHQVLTDYQDFTETDPFTGESRKVRIPVRRSLNSRTPTRIGRDDDYARRDDNYDKFETLLEILRDPRRWETTGLFDSRKRGADVEFVLAEDQFFPLGDNSPQSKDGRLWDSGTRFVDRRYLIGKALFIYWPHSLKKYGFPFVPNIGRMGFVR